MPVIAGPPKSLVGCRGLDALLSLFPPGTDADDDGMLRIGGCRADALAAEFGTPVMVVAEDALRARAREYSDELAARWPRSRVVFASKAFPCTAVQRVMVEEGLGLDVAGGGEIVTAIKAGADPALLVLHGNAKSDEEIAMAVEHGIGLVVVDNADDVDRLEATVPRARAGRARPGHPRRRPRTRTRSVLTGHAGSKFGLAPAAAAELIAPDRAQPAAAHARAARARRLADPRRRAVRRSRSRAVAALGEFPVYDLGGGLGARYTYADDARHRWRVPGRAGRRRARPPAGEAELIIEPGRSMVAAAAATLYRVVTVKRGAVTFVAVDGGMGDNLEVALYGQRFEAGSRIGSTATGGELVTLVGRHCESGDVLVDGVRLDARASAT